MDAINIGRFRKKIMIFIDACCRPIAHQTLRVKLFPTRVTRELWYLIGVDVEYAVAYVALLDTREFFVEVFLPHEQSFPDRAVLRVQNKFD